MRRLLAAVLLLAASPHAADAFCGFYISGGGAELFNNATQVVLMREGTHTVLSMQNNYQGPPENFAMVVPVPVVLQEQNVKTLPLEVFARVDKLGAPRLVEYWEQDPCQPEPDYEVRRPMMMTPEEAPMDDKSGGDLGVKIEAQFKVGEYDIVILSASESTGLDKWLRLNRYTIPEGAEPYLRPYVADGSKFFVAKVDIKKVKMRNGQAMLSPLRFDYDSQEFSLPIRLGMMNSSGTQDLIVNILARGKRYEVSNYDNQFIPTNIDVQDEVRRRFGEFYAALFDRTVMKHPGAVITEYSWDAGSCDPCPEPPLEESEVATLGADVLAGDQQGYYGFVLTRLHARYTKDGIKDDLVFREAKAVVGGREFLQDNGKLEEGWRYDSMNNFQGRYAIRHPWTGPIECLNPVRGRWGGPPADQQIATGPQAATDLAFAPRGAIALPMVVAEDIPEIGVIAGDASSAPPSGGPGVPKVKGKRSSCGGCAADGSGAAGGLLLASLVGLALLSHRRHRR
ncbi:MAG TPA: DUF2330 domain-containing protein [Kofleriaceae bacterium]|nr:DUF2330 domain-containing protein [Kofleriaceae bacterium]